MKLFVWDFHGVLEKNNEPAVTIITNVILEKFGYQERITDQVTAKLYGKKWYEYFEYLLPHEQNDRCMELQLACIKYGTAHPEIVFDVIEVNDHAHQVLRQVQSSNHHQILMSNTNPQALENFVDSIDVRQFFKEDHQRYGVNASIERDRKSKAQTLQDYLQDRNFSELVTIGDSPGDVELTSILSGTSYLYSHPGKDFRECQADYRIRDLREVLREI